MCARLQGGLPLEWGDGSQMSWQNGSVTMGPHPFMWRLQRLICNSCGLSGPLPNWQNLDRLRVVSLARNNLTGMSHFGARRLMSLSLDWNPLGTPLEPMLGWGWPLLRELSMSHCKLTGTLPPGASAISFRGRVLLQICASGWWQVLVRFSDLAVPAVYHSGPILQDPRPDPFTCCCLQSGAA